MDGIRSRGGNIMQTYQDEFEWTSHGRTWLCQAHLLQYHDGTTCLRLMDANDHSPIATASVNLTNYPQDRLEWDGDEDIVNIYEIPYFNTMVCIEFMRSHPNLVWIKTWSENEGIHQALLDAGILVPNQNEIDLEVDVNGYGSKAILSTINPQLMEYLVPNEVVKPKLDSYGRTYAQVQQLSIEKRKKSVG